MPSSTSILTRVHPASASAGTPCKISPEPENLAGNSHLFPKNLNILLEKPHLSLRRPLRRKFSSLFATARQGYSHRMPPRSQPFAKFLITFALTFPRRVAAPNDGRAPLVRRPTTGRQQSQPRRCLLRSSHADRRLGAGFIAAPLEVIPSWRTIDEQALVGSVRWD